MVMWVIAVVDVALCQCFSVIVASMTGAAINFASRRYEGDVETAREEIGYEEGTDENLAVDTGSDETWPEPEQPGESAYDQQAISTAFADAVASELLEECPAGSHC